VRYLGIGLTVGGAACVVAGLAMIYIPAGLIAAGLCLGLRGLTIDYGGGERETSGHVPKP
jgi:hypothetical protein